MLRVLFGELLCGTANKYPQHTFSWRNKKKKQQQKTEFGYPSYLKLWNIHLVPLLPRATYYNNTSIITDYIQCMDDSELNKNEHSLSCF